MKVFPAEMIKDFRLPAYLEKERIDIFSGKPCKPFRSPLFHDQPDLRGRIGSLGELLHDLAGDKVGNVGKDLIAAFGRQRGL